MNQFVFSINMYDNLAWNLQIFPCFFVGVLYSEHLTYDKICQGGYDSEKKSDIGNGSVAPFRGALIFGGCCIPG